MTTDRVVSGVGGRHVARLNRGLIGAIDGMERPALDDLTSARRIMSSEGLPIESSELRYGGSVTVEGREIADEERRIDVRIYYPHTPEDNRPAVVLLHGGAFVGGDLASEHARCLRFAAEARCVVISPAYALAPEVAYPGALNDCYSTLAWLAHNAMSVGVDAKRISLAGVSAGAALAAGTALLARDRGFPTVKALMLLYPALDDRRSTPSVSRFDDTPVWDAANTEAMWRAYLGDHEADGYAAPARAASVARLPRTYIAVAEFDPLRDEALEFAERLLAADVPTDLRLWGGGFHVFDQLVPDAPLSVRSLEDQVAFLRDAM